MMVVNFVTRRSVVLSKCGRNAILFIENSATHNYRGVWRARIEISRCCLRGKVTRSEGLRFIQFMKNRAFHSGIRRSPYEAMFGVLAKVGLENTSLPREIWKELEREEDVQRAISELHSDVPFEEPSPNQEQIEESHLAEHHEDSTIIPALENRKDAISRKRTATREYLTRQAKKM